MNEEYKPIPNFRDYAINKEGVVINVNTLNKVKISGDKVNMTGNWGKRTTRRRHLLMKEVWGTK